MHRPLLRGTLCLTLLVSGASACDRSSNQPPAPTTPTVTEITEPPFGGTLTINGGVSTWFSVTTVGTVSAIINELTPNLPDFSLSIGLALGTWNGTSCQIVLANDNAGVGSGVAGYANGAGTLCARVYDVGKLTEPVTFIVTIKHF
jgi:hypothetical protein